MMQPGGSLSSELKIVEQGDAVRLRPNADFAGILERDVLRVEQVLAIEDDFECAATELDAQSVPFAVLHGEVRPLELRPLAFDEMVDSDIVLQRVCPADVVIVRVLRAPD